MNIEYRGEIARKIKWEKEQTAKEIFDVIEKEKQLGDVNLEGGRIPMVVMVEELKPLMKKYNYPSPESRDN